MSMDRRVVRTKKVLTNALFQLLEEKELSQITVTELAQRAEVDRKTYYLHYNTPADILEDFYRDQVQRLKEKLRQEGIFEGSMDIAGFFRVTNELLAENLDLYRHLAKGGADSSFSNHLRVLLKEKLVAQMRRFVPQLPQEEVELYSLFCASGIHWVYRDWLTGALKMDADTLTRQVTHLVQHNIAALKQGGQGETFVIQ